MIFSKFLKPKWQHRNPNVRQLALKSLNDPAILNEMAQHDEAVEVRHAAIRKINDLSVLDQIAQQDEDGNARELAGQRFKQLLCCQKGDCPSLDTRLTWFHNISDAELINYIAQNGSEAQLRIVALKKVEREGLLGDIAINDSVSEVRFAALERLTQKSTLERVMKSARNSDKRVSRKAREKLDKIIEEKQRPVLIRNECEAICAKLDSLERRLTSESSLLQPARISLGIKALKQERAKLHSLQARWKSIAPDAETEFHPRFSKGERAVMAVFDRYQRAFARENALAPLRAAKKALCKQMEAVLIELKKRQRIGGTDEETLNQHINALQNEWLQTASLDDTDEEAQWQVHFERAYQSVQNRLKKLQTDHEIGNQLEALSTEAESLLENEQLLKPEHLQNLQTRWEKTSQPDDNSQPLFSELKNRFDNGLTALQARLQKQKERQKHAEQQFKLLLTDIETALEDGELKTAIPLEKQATQLHKDLKELLITPNKALDRRLQDCRKKIYDLRKWQHWGGEVERENLCSQVESLFETGEIPEKIVKITEQAQNSWKRLGSSGYSPELWERFNKACQTIYQRYREHLCVLIEKLSTGDENKPEEDARVIRQAQSTWKTLGSHGHSQETWERFNNACQIAYEPCRTHFNIKTQERDRNLFEKQSLCERLEQFTDETNWENADWKNVYHFVHDIEKSWRNIGQTDRKHKKTVQQRFQAAMRVIETYLDEERHHNCRIRVHIMGEVEEIAYHLQEVIDTQQGTISEPKSKMFIENKIGEAIEAIKKLQNQWQVTVPNNRRVEREFWRTFRNACDKVFNHRKQQQDIHKKEVQAYIEAKMALCEKVEKLAVSDRSTIENAITLLKIFKGDWQNINATWNQMPSNLRRKATEAIEGRFKKACSQVERQYQVHLATIQREQIDLLKLKAAFCVELEADGKTLSQEQNDEQYWNTTVQAAWTERPKLQNTDWESAIEQRFQLALAAAAHTGEQDISKETEHDKEMLCIRMEILAGCESPPESTQTRLAYQVARLSAAISDGKRNSKTPQSEAKELEEHWCLSGAVASEKTPSFEQRFKTACDTFYSQQQY
jgi:hypothetical protein